jgi:hypothetical protein
MEETMESRFLRTLQISTRTLQSVGPYLLLELLMPGGTLLALLLYCYRRDRADVVEDATRTLRAIADVFGPAVERVASALAAHADGRGTRVAARRRDGLEPLAMAPGA